MLFDGVDDSVRLAAMPGLPAEGWTVEAWVRPAPQSPERANIVAQRSPAGGCDTFTLRLRNDWGGLLELGFATRVDSWGMAGETPVPPEQWSHVAATWDASDRSASLWLNGRQDGRRQTRVGPGSCQAPVWLGGDPLHGPAGRPFAGHIDELRIWDHVRTQRQLQDHADRTLVGEEPGLLLHWALDEGDGVLARDDSPEKLHGTLGTGSSRAPGAPRWTQETPLR